MDPRLTFNSLHAVSSLDNRTSGIGCVVERMVDTLARLGHGVRVVTLGRAGDTYDGDIRIVRCPPNHPSPSLLAKLGRSREMRREILASPADVYHTHGLWMMPNVYPAEVARRFRKPFVLSPHGMLGTEALKFSSLAKRAFWCLWQKRAFAEVTCVHATAESEYNDIRAYGLTQPVAIVPNGIDLPDLVGSLSDLGQVSVPFVLSLGRIHPKKGLDRLIAAFALVAKDYPDWQLRIVGPDEGGHAAELRRQISAAKLESRVSIEPPVFDDEKVRLMRRAEVFALPTLDENFAMTVAESLAVETPVISTRGAPWSGLKTHQCGWWIEHGPAAMAVALREAMGMSTKARRMMGKRGRVWMQRDFSWDGIGAKMVAVYQWQLDRGPMPLTVRLN